MIIGLFLRYFKTYQGINYIPLTDEDKFCGLVGNNGIGKSSILESLDTLFNARAWNLNTVAKKRGTSSAKPQIVPIFMLQRSLFQGDILVKAEALNKITMMITEADVASALRPHVKKFIEHRALLELKVDLTDLLILPIGIDYEGKVSISIFNNRQMVEEILGAETEATKTSLSEDDLKIFNPLLEAIKNSIDYIYIPREIDPQLFTKLETAEIQM